MLVTEYKLSTYMFDLNSKTYILKKFPNLMRSQKMIPNSIAISYRSPFYKFTGTHQEYSKNLQS